jgi:predicted amidohydrolase
VATFGVIEVPARFGDVALTLAGIDALLDKTRADVVLLPETCLTGYVSPQGNFDLARFGEPINGPTAHAISERARARGIHLGAPIIERDEGGRHFNTYAIYAPDGRRLVRYRKRHPWFPEVWASPGDEPHPIFEIAGLTATIAICYDVHFLEAEAAEILDVVDVLIFPSAWVEASVEDDTRVEIFERLAKRFRIAIANANWTEGDVRLPGQGGSRIVGPDGRAFPWLTAELGRKHSRARP